MAGEVLSAVVAAAASIVVSAGTATWAYIDGRRTRREQAAAARKQAVTDENLEKLRSRLSDENDAVKAKRDYEYEARKRLYSELYPLAYQLNQAAFHAQHYILNLALVTREGHLAEGDKNWLTDCESYYFNRVVYSLMVPLAIHELMTRKLTLLDLRLDRALHLQHVIAGKAYETLRSDFNLSDKPYPAIVFCSGGQCYTPWETKPDVMPPEPEQRWTWRQGIYSGDISRAVDAMLTSDGTTTRVMTYAQFTAALGDGDLRSAGEHSASAKTMKRALKPLTDMFSDFHPARRPVTWRILLAQGACYRALIAAQRDEAASEDILRASRYTDAKDCETFNWIGDRTRSIPPALCDGIDFDAEQRSALATADLVIENVLSSFDG